jgi:hypothetical protein
VPEADMKAQEIELKCPEGRSPLLVLLEKVLELRRAAKTNLWFRGQSDAKPDWKLTPKVHRKFNRNGELLQQFQRANEMEMAVKFYMRAHVRRERCPP